MWSFVVAASMVGILVVWILLGWLAAKQYRRWHVETFSLLPWTKSDEYFCYVLVLSGVIGWFAAQATFPVGKQTLDSSRFD